MRKIMLLCAVLAALAGTTAFTGVPNTATPQLAENEPFSLAGTTWMGVYGEDWPEQNAYDMDTSIWRFETDSTGSIYEHWITIYTNDNIPNNDDGGRTFPMTYTFDPVTMTGILHGYQNYDFSDKPIEFTYNPSDKTLVYTSNTRTVVHRLVEK